MRSENPLSPRSHTHLNIFLKNLFGWRRRGFISLIDSLSKQFMRLAHSQVYGSALMNDYLPGDDPVPQLK